MQETNHLTNHIFNKSLSIDNNIKRKTCWVKYITIYYAYIYRKGNKKNTNEKGNGGIKRMHLNLYNHVIHDAKVTN